MDGVIAKAIRKQALKCKPNPQCYSNVIMQVSLIDGLGYGRAVLPKRLLPLKW